MIKGYSLFIPANEKYPDYQDYVEADSREEAVRMLTIRINQRISLMEEGKQWSEMDIDSLVKEIA
jgi:hypothetical protein